MQLANPWTQMQIKHKVTTSANTSSSGGCEMQWMSRDEGSDRQSRSALLCDGGRRCQDDFHKEREVRWCENLSRADECSFSKTFQIYECSPLDASIEVKKGGYIKVS